MQNKWMGLVLLSVVASVADAGEQAGKVEKLVARDSDGLVYMTMSGIPSGKPACAKNSYWMIKNENSESGKRQFAVLTAAMMAGKTVRVSGGNTCLRWSDGEDINWIMVEAN
ncbi:MAG: hypothetical protein ACK4E7_04375 [Permianibacter sp.]